MASRTKDKFRLSQLRYVVLLLKPEKTYSPANYGSKIFNEENMKQVIPFLILAIFSCSVAAEWMKVDKTVVSTMYVDKATISKNENGSLVRLWRMDDFSRSQVTKGKSRFSLKIQYEYDCRNVQLRVLGFSWYSGQMGEGEVVYSNTVPSPEEMPIMPDSYDEKFWKIACNKE